MARSHTARTSLALILAAAFAVVVVVARASAATATPAGNSPGGPLSTLNTTPFPSSLDIVGAEWSSPRFDPPHNQSGDILPTVWSGNGGTYVMMDDGGVDVPLPGGLWRQSVARVSGTPPHLRFQHVGDPSKPAPRTWGQIGGNRDNDDGPLGPYYSIGFTEAGRIFYATQQRNWNWPANGPFTGLAGIAYSTDHGETWHFASKPFGAPLGNLTFIDSGARGGEYPDGYVYAIGSEREFNASKLLLGRVRPGPQNVTDPSRWQWFAGTRAGAGGERTPAWTNSLTDAVPVLTWSSHITYPEMTYDRPLHRYLLTFTHSYSSQPPAVWRGGSELVILEAPTPSGPFSFVARSSEFGPSNGYSAGFPSQWISADGRDLWLKWAANFAGCARGLDCSGKYGFNVASVRLVARKTAVWSNAPTQTRSATHKASDHRVVTVVSAASLLLLLGFLGTRLRRLRTRPPRS
jgi:hypothetical protein